MEPQASTASTLKENSKVSGRSATSSPKRSAAQIPVEEKLKIISDQLAEVKKKRLEFDRVNSPPKRRAKKPEKSHERPKKNVLYHPKLDYIMGQIVYSPYMINPRDAYPRETFDVPEKLYELKRKSPKLKELPKELHPFDIKEIKKTFLKEVVNYNVSFTMPDDKMPDNLRKSLALRQSQSSSVSMSSETPSSFVRSTTNPELPQLPQSAGGAKEKKGENKVHNAITSALKYVNTEFADIIEEIEATEAKRSQEEALKAAEQLKLHPDAAGKKSPSHRNRSNNNGKPPTHGGGGGGSKQHPIPSASSVSSQASHVSKPSKTKVTPITASEGVSKPQSIQLQKGPKKASKSVGDGTGSNHQSPRYPVKLEPIATPSTAALPRSTIDKKDDILLTMKITPRQPETSMNTTSRPSTSGDNYNEYEDDFAATTTTTTAAAPLSSRKADLLQKIEVATALQESAPIREAVVPQPHMMKIKSDDYEEEEEEVANDEYNSEFNTTESAAITTAPAAGPPSQSVVETVADEEEEYYDSRPYSQPAAPVEEEKEEIGPVAVVVTPRKEDAFNSSYEEYEDNYEPITPNPSVKQSNYFEEEEEEMEALQLQQQAVISNSKNESQPPPVIPHHEVPLSPITAPSSKIEQQFVDEGETTTHNNNASFATYGTEYTDDFQNQSSFDNEYLAEEEDEVKGPVAEEQKVIPKEEYKEEVSVPIPSSSIVEKRISFRDEEPPIPINNKPAPVTEKENEKEAAEEDITTTDMPTLEGTFSQVDALLLEQPAPTPTTQSKEAITLKWPTATDDPSRPRYEELQTPHQEKEPSPLRHAPLEETEYEYEDDLFTSPVKAATAAAPTTANEHENEMEQQPVQAQQLELPVQQPMVLSQQEEEMPLPLQPPAAVEQQGSEDQFDDDYDAIQQHHDATVQQQQQQSLLPPQVNSSASYDDFEQDYEAVEAAASAATATAGAAIVPSNDTATPSPVVVAPVIVPEPVPTPVVVAPVAEEEEEYEEYGDDGYDEGGETPAVSVPVSVSVPVVPVSIPPLPTSTTTTSSDHAGYGGDEFEDDFYDIDHDEVVTSGGGGSGPPPAASANSNNNNNQKPSEEEYGEEEYGEEFDEEKGMNSNDFETLVTSLGNITHHMR